MFPVRSTKTEHQFGAAAIAICISWFNLIWFLRRIPDIGTYILTLQKVFKTLVKVNDVNYTLFSLPIPLRSSSLLLVWCGRHLKII